jgi:catechol 2,3-dioxygenase-like lactoylglutathione lyase family enzyme
MPAVHHLALLVDDLARAERFYVDVLGLPVVKRWTDDDGAPRSIWVGLDDAFLAIEKAPPGATLGTRGWSSLALRIEAHERAAWRARFSEHGIAIEHETAFTLYVRDPEGNRVGVSAWPEAG